VKPKKEKQPAKPAKPSKSEKKKLPPREALAKALHIGVRTIAHLRKQGAPAGNDLEAWRKFLELRATANLTGLNDVTAEHLPAEIQKLRARLLAAQTGKEEAIRKLRELELRQRSENLVPMAEAKDAVKRVLAPLAGLLESMPKAVALQANPTDPLLAEEAVRAGLDKVFTMMGEELEK